MKFEGRNREITFDEVQLRELFGHEAAEDEEIDRLRQYYFKTNTYEQVTVDLPLRILVGHKGIGKSALFQVAMAEERERDRITILIRPDDVTDLGANPHDFLRTIREWKLGISEIVVRKVLAEVGAGDPNVGQKLLQWSGSLASYLLDTFQNLRKGSTETTNRALVNSFLRSKKVSVYIDDLDRGWQGRKEDNIRISALLNAIRDITSESKGINFRVSLRSDVYYLVRTSDESTDKLEGSVIWHSWTNHEIFVVLIKRIESFFGIEVDEDRLQKTDQKVLSVYLKPVMEEIFSGEGHWRKAPMYRVLMSLVRKRPRDLVKLCTLAGRAAAEDGSNLIETHHVRKVFEEYSQGRLQDTINEYRSELPGIEKLLLSMKPTKKGRTTKEGYVYTTDSLLKKIKNISEQGQFKFSDGRIADEKALAAFMYKINFLTARKEAADGLIDRKYFEENRYLSNQFVDFGYDWEIHPAYRWALQPDDINGIFKILALSVDD